MFNTLSLVIIFFAAQLAASLIASLSLCFVEQTGPSANEREVVLPPIRGPRLCLPAPGAGSEQRER